MYLLFRSHSEICTADVSWVQGGQRVLPVQRWFAQGWCWWGQQGGRPETGPASVPTSAVGSSVTDHCHYAPTPYLHTQTWHIKKGWHHFPCKLLFISDIFLLIWLEPSLETVPCLEARRIKRTVGGLYLHSTLRTLHTASPLPCEPTDVFWTETVNRRIQMASCRKICQVFCPARQQACQNDQSIQSKEKSLEKE